MATPFDRIPPLDRPMHHVLALAYRNEILRDATRGFVLKMTYLLEKVSLVRGGLMRGPLYEEKVIRNHYFNGTCKCLEKMRVSTPTKSVPQHTLFI